MLDIIVKLFKAVYTSYNTKYLLYITEDDRVIYRTANELSYEIGDTINNKHHGYHLENIEEYKIVALKLEGKLFK